jgi:hypothetical protein
MQLTSVLAVFSVTLYLTGWGYVFGYLNYFGIDSNMVDISFQKILISNIYVVGHLFRRLSTLGTIAIIIFLLGTASTGFYLTQRFAEKLSSIRQYVPFFGALIAVFFVFACATWTSDIGGQDARAFHRWLLGRPGAPIPSRLPESVELFLSDNKSLLSNVDATFYLLGQNGSAIFVVGVYEQKTSRITRVFVVPYDVLQNFQIDALQKRG